MMMGAAPVDEPKKGGNMTMYIIVFLLCVISGVSIAFYFTNKSQADKLEEEKNQIKADMDAKIKEAETELEAEKVKMESEAKIREAEMESAAKIREATALAREEQLKKLEENVNAELEKAAATVREATTLKRNAQNVSNDAADKLKAAQEAQAKADATGKANDVKLAAEKKRLADDAAKKVAAANKRATDAGNNAKAEAQKAVSLKNSLDQANAALAAARSAQVAVSAPIIQAAVPDPFPNWRFERNIDYPGNDVFHLHSQSSPIANRINCITKCNQMGNCNLVTMNNAHTLCWGKSKAANSRPQGDRMNFFKPAVSGPIVQTGGVASPPPPPPPAPAFQTFSLRGGKGNKFCADEGNRVICNRDAVGAWEKFKFEPLGGNVFAIRGGKDNKYCADDADQMRCNRNAIGAWEKFTVQTHGPPILRRVSVKGGRGNKFCADEGNRVICNRDAVGAWERFWRFAA
jgi:hypothetical protein